MSAALAIPMDVRLMNSVAAILLAIFLALAGMTALGWTARQPAFAIRGMEVLGEVTHYNAVTLRANVLPQLSGGLFTMDLARARKAFESLPWVRRAVVRRQFPDRLRVQLQEHQAVAFWGSEDESSMVNSFGEVFEANVGEVDRDKLPRLLGPASQSAHVLQVFRALTSAFETLDMNPEQLELSQQGSWRVQMDSGATIELGGGTDEEIMARVQRFVHTLNQITSRWGRHADALEYADLRYPQGYALRLQGVSTKAQPSTTQH